MLARRELPPEFAAWNRRWSAPYGRKGPAVTLLEMAARRQVRRARGPFGFQGNSTTRSFEYPWAYYQLNHLGPSRILEIGGAFSGFQFVLAKDGHEVHNIDPFVDYGNGGYTADPMAEHATLNRSFGTNVQLHRSTLSEIKFPSQFSAIVCISTLEHLPSKEMECTLLSIKDLLIPGGLLVLTVDLFLDLKPFSNRTTNVWGTNASIAWMEDVLGYPMIAGNRAELNGYKEFSADQILGRLGDFAINTGYPAMAQLVTFQRPES